MTQERKIYHLPILLNALQPLTLRGYGGEEAHALFFTLLQKVDASLADELHRLPQKPFSLHLDASPHRPEKGALSIPEKASFTLNLHYFGLQPEIIAKSLLAKHPARSLFLSSGKIKIHSVQAHSTSFQEIFQQSNPETRITLCFLTPTCFRQKGKSVLFPDPSLVFASLLDRWNAFSPIAFPPDLKHLFPQILIGKYHLHTELVPFSNYKIIGFKGECEYHFPKEFSEPERKMLFALASFAEFSGVGYKTPMGFGATSL